MPASNKVEIIISAKNITGKAMTQVQKRLDAVKKRVFSLQGAVAALAGGYGVKKLAESFLDAGLSADKMGRSLVAATGSVEAAEDAQRFLRQESERLGLVFQDQIRDYQRISAAARGTALDTEAIRQVYLGVTEASTALQLSQAETAGALNAISQMISKGTVQAEELRGQLGERLPGAFQIAARAMGVTTMELGKMLEQGQVVADVFLPRFASQLRKEFAGQIEQASQSARSSINRLQNTWFELRKTVMESGVMEEFNAQLVAINEQMREWLTTNEDMIKQKVPEYIEKTKNALKKIWDIISYDPAILEWGLVGLAIGGKKWAVIVGGVAHMATWAGNLAKALGMASAGLISMKEIAEANFEELEKLVKKGEELMQGGFFRGKIPPRPAPPKPQAPTVFGELQTEKAKKLDRDAQRHIDQAINRIRQRVKAEEDAAEAISTTRAEAYQEWYDEQIVAREALKDTSQVFGEDLKNAVTGWASTWSQSLNDMVWGAEMSFGKILESFGRMITQMIIQKGVVEPILSKVGTVAMSFAGSTGTGAQHGAIVSVMGEHRPEAIMPLARTPTGDLGIKTSDGGGSGGGDTHIYINAVDARSFAELTQRNPQAITGPVVEALRAGGQFRSSLRSAIL